MDICILKKLVSTNTKLIEWIISMCPQCLGRLFLALSTHNVIIEKKLNNERLFVFFICLLNLNFSVYWWVILSNAFKHYLI